MRRFTASVGILAVGVAGLVATANPVGALGVIEIASVDASGWPLHKTSDIAMSDDGSRVAFIANSDGQRNLLLRDRAAGTTTEVSASFSQAPSLSGDGNVVVYRAGFSYVKAYDIATQTTSHVAVPPSGTVVPGGEAFPGGVSADGRFVSFRHNSAAGFTNGVWLRDRVDGTTIKVSNIDPVLQASGFGPGPVSDDGNTVAFSAYVRVPGHPFNAFQSFVWTRDTNTASIVSLDTTGVPHSRDAFVDDMTPDGRYVAFHTGARLSPSDPNLGATDVYLHDRLTATTTYVGANFSEEQYASFGSNMSARVTDDGTQVAFVTDALIAGKWTHDQDAVIANLSTGTLELVSKTVDGAPAGGVNPEMEFSGDGRYLGFVSNALTMGGELDTGECAEFERDEETNQYVWNYGNCSNAYVLDRAVSGGYTPGGGTASDGSTSVQLPAGVSGTVTIAPATGTNPVPDGYEILGQQVQIEAPVAMWDDPLRLTFTVPSPGVAPADIAVIRDGVPVADCLGAVDALPPDAGSADGHPCVTSRSLAGDGSAVLVVLTPHASVWSMAKVPPPATPDVTFASLSEATQSAVSNKGIAQSLCAKLAAASASTDRGDGPSAARQLEAYRSALSAQSGKSVGAAQAAALIEKSRQL